MNPALPLATTSPVVVDGHVNREKLLELLAIGAEHADIVAMMN